MITKLVCLSLLASSSIPAFAQDATRHASADMFLKFPGPSPMHRYAKRGLVRDQH